jgi:hypothetical protein
MTMFPRRDSRVSPCSEAEPYLLGYYLAEPAAAAWKAAHAQAGSSFDSCGPGPFFLYSSTLCTLASVEYSCTTWYYYYY